METGGQVNLKLPYSSFSPRRRFNTPNSDTNAEEAAQKFSEPKTSIPDPVAEQQKISQHHLRPPIADDEPTTDWIPEIPFQNVWKYN